MTVMDSSRPASEPLVVQLYRDEVLTLGQAAKLAGLPLGDFIDLCGTLRVPVLWPPPEGIEGISAGVDVLAAALGPPEPGS
jgi:hypothetical protein